MSGIEWLTKALSEQGIELTEQQQQQFQTIIVCLLNGMKNEFNKYY